MSGTSERHIVLVGPMGAGKTVIGAELARQLDRPFLDSDRELEVIEGATAAQVAESSGVGDLHRLELDLLHRMTSHGEPAVIAAAASVVDTEAGVAVLRRHHAVWLDADATTLARRSAGSDHRRPILDAEAKRLHADRVRRSAACTVASVDTGQPIGACVTAIVDTMEGPR